MAQMHACQRGVKRFGFAACPRISRSRAAIQRLLQVVYYYHITRALRCRLYNTGGLMIGTVYKPV